MRNRFILSCGAVLAGCLAGVSAPDPKNPYGACAHITRGEPAARTSAMLRQAGIGRVRCDFQWGSLEAKPGQWDFAAFDKVLDECEAAGVEALPVLCYSVAWANPAYAHLDAWGEYVKRVVTRYGRRLPVLEAWNEQNSALFFPNPSPTNYLALLRRTYEVVKAHDPALRVSFGGTAGIPFDFIEEVYRLGGAKYFDIISVHPYSHPDTPEGRLDRDLERLRAIMAKYGDAEKPIWITEIGWTTPRPCIDDSSTDLLRAGLRVADPARKTWRTVYVPAVNDDWRDTGVIDEIRAALPEGSTVEMCTGPKLAARLSAGDVDAIVFPFGENYCADCMDTVVDFVKAGGTLVDFGGIPFWYACRTNSAGRQVKLAGNSGWRDRQRLRIDTQSWWMDGRYPEDIRVNPTGEAIGARVPQRTKSFRGQRFFTSKFLKPGDTLEPLLTAETNGVATVAAGVYKFNSDFKGRVVVSGLIGLSTYNSISEEGQALMYARSLGIAFAEGVAAFFCYEFRDTDAHPGDSESYFGMVRQNFAPKPAYAAYMTFVGQRPAGSVQKTGTWRNADGLLYFPQWTRPDGRDAGMAWTTGEPVVRRLTFTSNRMEFCDVKGARVRPKRDGNAYLLPLSDSPIYFVGGALKATP